MTPRKTTQNGASSRARTTRNSRAVQSTRASSSRSKPASAAKSSVRKAPPNRASAKVSAKPHSRSASVKTRPVNAPAARNTSSRPKSGPFLPMWGVVLLGFALVVVLLGSYYPVARVQYRELREQARLRAELAAVQAHNKDLQRDVARLNTPEGVEDLARSDLGLVKKGEHVVVVIDDEVTSTPVEPRIDAPSDVSPAGPWTAFLDRFFAVE